MSGSGGNFVGLLEVVAGGGASEGLGMVRFAVGGVVVEGWCEPVESDLDLLVIFLGSSRG